MKIIARVLAVLSCALATSLATAAPPYSITGAFNAAPGASSHRLYRGCKAGETKVLMGTVTSGQPSSATLGAPGVYSFCVHGVNAQGEGPVSNVYTVDIQDAALPGAPSSLVITVTCAPIPGTSTPSCTFIVQP